MSAREKRECVVYICLDYEKKERVEEKKRTKRKLSENSAGAAFLFAGITFSLCLVYLLADAYIAFPVYLACGVWYFN